MKHNMSVMSSYIFNQTPVKRDPIEPRLLLMSEVVEIKQQDPVNNQEISNTEHASGEGSDSIENSQDGDNCIDQAKDEYLEPILNDADLT